MNADVNRDLGFIFQLGEDIADKNSSPKITSEPAEFCWKAL